MARRGGCRVDRRGGCSSSLEPEHELGRDHERRPGGRADSPDRSCAGEHSCGRHRSSVGVRAARIRRGLCRRVPHEQRARAVLRARRSAGRLQPERQPVGVLPAAVRQQLESLPVGDPVGEGSDELQLQHRRHVRDGGEVRSRHCRMGVRWPRARRWVRVEPGPAVVEGQGAHPH